MKNMFLAAVAAVMLALSPLSAIADEACEGGSASFSETIAMADAMGVAHVSLTGESLDKFDKYITDKLGVPKPAEIVSIVGPSRDEAMNVDVVFLTAFKADGCPYGMATFEPHVYLDALTAAGFGPEA